MRKLTPESIGKDTFWSKMYYDSRKKDIQKYESDTFKDDRLRHQMCKTCYYLKSQIGLSAFHNFECGNCGETHSHPSSAVPKYCRSCARKHNACVDCGGEI